MPSVKEGKKTCKKHPLPKSRERNLKATTREEKERDVTDWRKGGGLGAGGDQQHLRGT